MSKVTSRDGTTIAFDRAGEGPALVLVDGAMCYRAFGPMPPLAQVLAPDFTVYTYDRRGRAANVAVPTLVAAGGASPDMLRRPTKALADAIPGAKYQTLEGQTREVSPDAIAAVLREFFL